MFVLQVKIVDTNKGASCEVVADPHIRTCDGKKYDSHIQDIGTETILYINYRYQQQVRSGTERDIGSGGSLIGAKHLVNL